MTSINSTYEDEINQATVSLLEIFPEAELTTVAEAVTCAISLSGEKAYNILVEQAVAIYLELVERDTNSSLNQKLTLERNAASSSQFHPDVEQTDSSSSSSHSDGITLTPSKSVSLTTEHVASKSTDDTILPHPGHSSVSLPPSSQRSSPDGDKNCIEPNSSVLSIDRNQYTNDKGKVLPHKLNDCSSNLNENKHDLFTGVNRDISLQDYEDILPFEVNPNFLQSKENRLKEDISDQNVLSRQGNLNNLHQTLPTMSHGMSGSDSSSGDDSMAPVQKIQLKSSLKHPAKSSKSSLSSNKSETYSDAQENIALTINPSPISSTSNTHTASGETSMDLEISRTMSQTSTSNTGKRSHVRADSGSPPCVPRKKANLETKSSEMSIDDEWPVLVPCKTFSTPRKKVQTALNPKNDSEKRSIFIDLTDDMDVTDSVTACSLPNTDRKPDVGKLQQELMSKLNDLCPSVVQTSTMADSNSVSAHPSSLQSALKNNLSPKPISSDHSSSSASTGFPHPLIALPPGCSALLLRNPATPDHHLFSHLPGSPQTTETVDKDNVTKSPLTSSISSKSVESFVHKPGHSAGTVTQSSVAVSLIGVSPLSAVQQLSANGPGTVQLLRVNSPSQGTASPQRFHTQGAVPQLMVATQKIGSQQVRAITPVGTPQLKVLFPGLAQQARSSTSGTAQQARSSTSGTAQQARSSTSGTAQQARSSTSGTAQQARSSTSGTAQQARSSTSGTAQQARSSTSGTAQKIMSLTSGTPQQIRALTPGTPQQIRALTPGIAQQIRELTQGTAQQIRALTPGTAQQIRALTRGTAQQIMSLTPGIAQQVRPLTPGIAQQIMSLTPGTAQQIMSLTPGIAQQIMSLTPGTAQQVRPLTPGTTQVMPLTPETAQQIMTLTPGTAQQIWPLTPETAQQIMTLTPETAQQIRPLTPGTAQQIMTLTRETAQQIRALTPGTAQQIMSLTPGIAQLARNSTSGAVQQIRALTPGTDQRMVAPTLGTAKKKRTPTPGTVAQKMRASTAGTPQQLRAIAPKTSKQPRATPSNAVLLLPESFGGESMQDLSSEVVIQQITSFYAPFLPDKSQSTAEPSHKSTPGSSHEQSTSMPVTLKQFNINAAQFVATSSYEVDAQSHLSPGSFQSEKRTNTKEVKPANGSPCATIKTLEMSSLPGSNISIRDQGGTKPHDTIPAVQGLLDLPSTEIANQECKQIDIPMPDISVGQNTAGNYFGSRHLKSIANNCYGKMSQTFSAQSLNAVMSTMNKLFLMKESDSLRPVKANSTSIAWPVLQPSTSNSKGLLNTFPFVKDKPVSPPSPVLHKATSLAHSPTQHPSLSLAVNNHGASTDRVLSYESTSMEVDSIASSSVPSKSVKKEDGATGYSNYRVTNNMDTDEDITLTDPRLMLKPTDDVEADGSTFSHESGILECSACSTSSALHKCVSCSAGHSICKSCVEEEIQSVMLSKQKMGLLCTAKSCQEQLFLTSLELIVDAFVLGLLRKNIQQKEMEASSNVIKNMEGLVSCPSCKYSGLMENEQHEFVCGNNNCTVRCCRYCKSKWTNKDDHLGCYLLSSVGTECFNDIQFSPLNWEKTDMSRNDFQVKIDPTSLEGLGWNEYFQKTNPKMRIVALWRIQNRRLWERYVVKRKHMVEELGFENIQEKALFHGTKFNNIKVICSEGFDFRVQAANGSALGRGIYFSKTSAYSQKFACAKRHMFVARVLCGQSTCGNQNLTRPPHNRSGRMFDSCVDNLASPTMYTVFDNSQCYPEILLQFN